MKGGLSMSGILGDSCGKKKRADWEGGRAEGETNGKRLSGSMSEGDDGEIGRAKNGCFCYLRGLGLGSLPLHACTLARLVSWTYGNEGSLNFLPPLSHRWYSLVSEGTFPSNRLKIE